MDTWASDGQSPSAHRLSSASRSAARKKHCQVNFRSMIMAKGWLKWEAATRSRKFVLRLLRGYYRVHIKVFAAELLP